MSEMVLSCAQECAYVARRPG